MKDDNVTAASGQSSGAELLLKFWNLGKLGAGVGIAQIIVQGIGFLSGILVIRLLPTNEYALYTLANTMLGTMTILADGGISSGVMAQGGKVWQDREKLGAVLAAGMRLRKQFAFYSLLVSVPILLFLLNKNGSSWLFSLLITLSLIPAFFSQLSGKLLEISPKLKQDVAPLQRIQVEANIGRLFLTALTVFLFPFSWVAVLCAGASQLFANWRLRKVSNEHANPYLAENVEVRNEILHIVKRKLPAAAYYCVSGQLTVWLIALFGTTEALGQVGALGRLTMALGIVSTLLNYLVVPRFSRLPAERYLLVGRFLLVVSSVLLLATGILILVAKFPSGILWILGDAYTGLSKELLLITLSSLVGLLSSTCNWLNSSRGWIVSPIIFIVYTLAFQVLSVIFFDISKIAGVILVSLTVHTGQFVLQGGYFIYRVQKP